LDRYLALIKSWVPFVPAELIFNLDETGLSDWEEKKPKPVLIPIVPIPQIEESVIRCSSAACQRQEMLIARCFSVQIPPLCQYFI
jgi:hypothetical protein